MIELAPVFGILGLGCALVVYRRIMKQPVGSKRIHEIAEAIHEGAMAFLKREYVVLAIFVLLVAGILSFGIDLSTATAFVFGSVCSILAGFLGMKAATRANARTAWAANQHGQAEALSVAFSGGTVMGLAVASLGLLGVGILFRYFGSPDKAQVISGFAMGASSIALFARVGGGIYTKTADVGADLVGKVEAGIPEDDPRNPAVIADAVGDNVGDVAGMGADIFESYVGSIIATIAIAATASSALIECLSGSNADAGQVQILAMQLPVVIAMVGLVASLVAVFSMRLLRN
ncbi:MAG: sodium/proton-translocating pyrophosphatase, partial [Candidatus Latescibacterota bacterium]|nr:sodium/proton-translocating pyrophosphatase [Candidatus Latescibacterota bacterium]